MTRRLENALTKLYNAFHNDQLQPECAMGCAVGTILDRRDFWKHLSDDHGTVRLNYLGLLHENLGRSFNGYKPSELLLIEKTFLDACGYETPLRHYHKKPKNPTDKDLQFKGLCAVVAVLCQLDNVPNVLTLNTLFDRVADKPKYALEQVLAF